MTKARVKQAKKSKTPTPAPAAPVAPSTAPALVQVRTVAQALGVRPGLVWSWIKRGAIRGLQAGPKARYSVIVDSLDGLGQPEAKRLVLAEYAKTNAAVAAALR